MPVTFLSLDKSVRGDEIPAAVLAKHKKNNVHTVYVGRTWGGLKGHVLGSSNWNLAKYSARVRTCEASVAALEQLKREYSDNGNRICLACWCAPWAYSEKRCHARVLCQLIEGADAQTLEREYDEQFAHMQSVERERTRMTKRKRDTAS